MTQQCLWYPNQIPLTPCEAGRLFKNSLSGDGDGAYFRTRGTTKVCPRPGHEGLFTSPEQASFLSHTPLLNVTSQPVPTGHTSPQV